MEPLIDSNVIQTIRELNAIQPEDSFSHELLNIFAKQSESIVENLIFAASVPDMRQLRLLAHRLKGAAANIGAKELSRRATAIENLISTSDFNAEELARAVHELAEIRHISMKSLRELL